MKHYRQTGSRSIDFTTREVTVDGDFDEDITAESVRFAFHQALRAARPGNRTHRGRAGTATPAQVREQVAALTEQVHALTALVLSLTGADAELDDDTVLTP